MGRLRDKIREEIRQRNEREDRIRSLGDAYRGDPDFTFPDDAPLAALKPALSTRSFNCLRNEDLETVGQLRQRAKSYRDLLNIPNLGAHSAIEIAKVVGLAI
jgi:DNA-directed RNA polymerase alpha subunit